MVPPSLEETKFDALLFGIRLSLIEELCHTALLIKVVDSAGLNE